MLRGNFNEKNIINNLTLTFFSSGISRSADDILTVLTKILIRTIMQILFGLPLVLTHQWQPNRGWRGGAAKFTPCTSSSQGYSGLGQLHGLSGTRINI